MESDALISQELVETGGFKNVPPVILASGEVGFYYINTEKLSRDGGKFKDYGNDSKAMYNHAVNMTQEHPKFKAVTDRITEKAEELLPEVGAISGGQTRDWLFSCPVAHNLNVPHISIYKNEKMESISPSGTIYGIEEIDRTKKVLHIADLLTEASSCYRVEGDVEKGWVPSLRQKGFEVNKLIAVVDRMQGGVERLKAQGVEAHCFVGIDENFLRQHSENSERDIAYNQNPRQVVEDYLRKNGAIELVGTFDPNGGKIDRAKKFLERYKGVLKQAGKYGELDSAAQDKFGESLDKLTQAV